MITRTGRRIALVVSMIGMVLLTAADAEANGTLPRNAAYQPGELIAGMTYGDWSAAWWQWVGTIDPAMNPLTDDTGEYCAEGQSSGPVFFLAGNFGGETTRDDCTVPEGKILVLPLINVECSTNESLGTNARELRFCAGEFADQFTPLGVSVDGKSVARLEDFRAQSPSFAWDLPSPNVFGATSGPGRSVADGFWVALKPLSPGSHTVSFAGAYGEGPDYPFFVDMTYNLVIE